VQVVFQPPYKPPIKTLSILIPVYNEERYLAAVVKRVVDQPLPEGLTREIIMVNDASKDKTWDIMQQIPAHFPHVTFKLLPQPRQVLTAIGSRLNGALETHQRLQAYVDRVGGRGSRKLQE
jgi:glycosyltransferase involved in cell wall biosynthesis